ncbi:hypothetical protein F5I97DRAFT_1827203 [Phlebopus sp. FC_14]|nr:hypothetical protein F5I97DRAFT_1827203 [Phlebopus sp. FC_14]
MHSFDDPTSTMLSSDTASSSSSPPSPHIRRNRLTRKHSPSRHRYSAESDVARLLYPAYASHTPRPPHTTPHVYVDNLGHLHDPDFRHFPPFGHTSMHKARWDDTRDDDSDDDEYEIEQKRIALNAQRRRPSSSTYYTVPPYYTYEDPSSYESNYLAEDDEPSDHHERAPLKNRYLRPRSKSPEKRNPIQNEKPDASPAEDDQQVVSGDSEWTPTCTQSLRRQWQAIALSFRFTLFRTKRRIQRRMSR